MSARNAPQVTKRMEQVSLITTARIGNPEHYHVTDIARKRKAKD